MQVETANAPAKTYFDGRWVYFCSDNCKERFEKTPELQQRVTRGESGPMAELPARSGSSATDGAIDPICGMTVDVPTAQYRSTADGVMYYFCSSGCKERFDRIHRKDDQMSNHDDRARFTNERNGN